jgi:hypothetical protein
VDARPAGNAGLSGGEKAISARIFQKTEGERKRKGKLDKPMLTHWQVNESVTHFNP